jgi:hypothetical protein
VEWCVLTSFAVFWSSGRREHATVNSNLASRSLSFPKHRITIQEPGKSQRKPRRRVNMSNALHYFAESRTIFLYRHHIDQRLN